MKYIIITIILTLLPLTTQAKKPPRLIYNCEHAFIGYEYNPRLEPICRSLWNEWTRQIKNERVFSYTIPIPETLYYTVY